MTVLPDNASSIALHFGARDLDWNDHTAYVRVEHNEVHLWRFHVGDGSAAAKAGVQLLAADELHRAARYRRPQDRDRFIANRAFLRRVLAVHLGQPAENLGFEYNEDGKPGIKDGAEIEFSLSHSHEVAFVAVSKVAVGADIQQLDRHCEALAIAERFFTSAEIAALKNSDVENQRAEFFRIWTRKESCVKASGTRLERALNHLCVLSSSSSSSSSSSARKCVIENVGKTWLIQDQEVFPGYSGAFAVELRGQSEIKVKCWQMT